METYLSIITGRTISGMAASAAGAARRRARIPSTISKAIK